MRRLIQAQGSASDLSLDDSKLAQTQRLITDLRKRLEVSQRLLARESRFVERIQIEAVDEESLLEDIDTHFENRPVTSSGDKVVSY